MIAFFEGTKQRCDPWTPSRNPEIVEKSIFHMWKSGNVFEVYELRIPNADKIFRWCCSRKDCSSSTSGLSIWTLRRQWAKRGSGQNALPKTGMSVSTRPRLSACSAASLECCAVSRLKTRLTEDDEWSYYRSICRTKKLALYTALQIHP